MLVKRTFELKTIFTHCIKILMLFEIFLEDKIFFKFNEKILDFVRRSLLYGISFILKITKSIRDVMY